ncbi:hypothetical protein [Amycolatopsis sp. NPDC049868]|uniref:hypothetical protein n=1 Tax=Amycolatopsis sp. NPDC049868 TaxID=3363934 RepID=UPI0037BA742C
MRSLVVGLGRTGAGLHLPALANLRTSNPQLFDNMPVMACEPGQNGTTRPSRVIAPTLGTAASPPGSIPVTSNSNLAAEVSRPGSQAGQVDTEQQYRGVPLYGSVSSHNTEDEVPL